MDIEESRILKLIFKFFFFFNRKSFSFWGRRQRQTGREKILRPVFGNPTFHLKGRLGLAQSARSAEVSGIDRSQGIQRPSPRGGPLSAMFGSGSFHPRFGSH